MATADATSHSSTLPADRPGFGATLLSEWTKLRSVRSTYIFVGLAIILSVGMTALMSFIVGSTWEEWPPDQRAQFNPVLFSLFGNVFYAIQHLDDSSLMYLDFEVAVAALAVWLIAFVGGAYLALKKRDA